MSKVTAKINNQPNNQPRGPVVAVLGHIDHGKSSLLEAIRSDFSITKKESGGITQHIGAYEIERKGKKISFIDTPGHEAFSAIRQRGANVADIALLVIDGAEGVKDQTKEAIKFIKSANIPLIVVFNKKDKPGFDPEKVKPYLAKEDILVESWGGKVLSVNTSAKNKEGIEELLEAISLVAEMEDLQADLTAKPEGIVIESSLDPQRGAFATLLLQQGTLKEGEIIATHFAFGKVKGMFDFKGKKISKALPSQPVSVLGFSVPPGVGEKFKAHDSLALAQNSLKKEERIAPKIIDVQGGVKVLNIILKTDFLGSQEAVENILNNMPQDKVALRVLRSEVGQIDASDVKLAESGLAVIFGFKLKVDEPTLVFARQRGVRIKCFEVIYELVQEVRKVMLGALDLETTRVELSRFKITHLFKQTKQIQIVGGKVLTGEFTRAVLAEVERDEEIIGKAKIKGLQKEKQEVGKATKGQEIGLQVESEVVLEENDILKIFREDKTKGSL
ncbi:MAG: translation initiation factor IF-2 [Parcubacteria group bacterium CG1_02_37_13]|nr:MAG: translation initiation factor IF-2 [Parcubacteria group bacterium CG1_02_37_13]